MIRAIFVLLILYVAALAQEKPACVNPVLVKWQVSDIHIKDVSDWWGKEAKAHPKFCPVDKLESAKYVFVLAETSYQTTYTMEVPHTVRSTASGTITDTSTGQTADIRAEIRTTEYEIQVHPTSCAEVHLYVFRKDDPKLLGDKGYIYTPRRKALRTGASQVLIAQGGSSVTSTKCDYGRAHPAKDLVIEALKRLGESK